MKIRTIVICVFSLIICLTSCYEDFVSDNEVTSIGFALSNPLRTVVANRDPIYVGVSIGGKREVDLNDWASFEIDETLLEGTGFKILPNDYYTLSNQNTFTVRKKNLPVADVRIDFTEKFFQDENSLGQYYAIPFKVTDSSLDQIREGAETSVVAIKYISSFSGSYYLIGSVKEINKDGTPIEGIENKTYGNNIDIIKSPICTVTTLAKNKVLRHGIAEIISDDMYSLELTIENNNEVGGDYCVTINVNKGNIQIIEQEAKYISRGEFTYNGNGDEPCPQINLKYVYTLGGKYYDVNEKLVLRRDPIDDLRVETW